MEPVSAVVSPVTVWATESLLVRVTVPPTATVTSDGENAMLLMTTAAGASFGMERMAPRYVPQTPAGHIRMEARAIEGTCAMPENLPMPQPGETAPAIDAETTGGGRFVLSDHAGQWVVVYFYPRANTPG